MTVIGVPFAARPGDDMSALSLQPSAGAEWELTHFKRRGCFLGKSYATIASSMALILLLRVLIITSSTHSQGCTHTHTYTDRDRDGDRDGDRDTHTETHRGRTRQRK